MRDYDPCILLACQIINQMDLHIGYVGGLYGIDWICISCDIDWRVVLICGTSRISLLLIYSAGTFVMSLGIEYTTHASFFYLLMFVKTIIIKLPQAV